ncbi:hypothetical protein [Sutterella wadsworthensis]|nr:hypothetical protein [Sutterella wadsworthensis]
MSTKSFIISLPIITTAVGCRRVSASAATFRTPSWVVDGIVF